MVNIFRRFHSIFKEYCLNCSLAGVCYIADSRYHVSERLFWVVCVILSWFGSYNLITNFMESYYKNLVSIGVISLLPTDTVNFPSIGLCEMGYTKENYVELTAVIEEMRFPDPNNEDGELVEYNYDVEDFLTRVVFHNLYNFGSMSSYCVPYINSADEIPCPVKDYQSYADRIRADCPKLFVGCSWNEKPFDCCKYFRPVKTSLGTCFLINSIQAVKKNGDNWLDMTVGKAEGNGLLQFSVTKSSALFFLNEEDIPHMLLTMMQFPIIPEGFDGDFQLGIKDMINEENVISVPIERRKCIFPDEDSGSAYKKYSFSTCVTDCVKQAQIKTCNCTHHNYIVDENDKSPACGYEGLTCLDEANLMLPQTTIMQPWRTEGLVCKCLPSCTELQTFVIGRSSVLHEHSKLRNVTISLQEMPTQRFFRQAVREKVDIVGELLMELLIFLKKIKLLFFSVSVGGILGLFMGASILSLVEFLYFFTIRAFRPTVADNALAQGG